MAIDWYDNNNDIGMSKLKGHIGTFIFVDASWNSGEIKTWVDRETTSRKKLPIELIMQKART